MSATLNAVSITGHIGAGSIVLNDYALNIVPIDHGYRLTVTRGSETQTMDILDGIGIAGIKKTGSTGDVDSYRITFTDGSTFEYTVETNAAAHAAAEAARVEAENSREGAEAARASAEAGRADVENARVAAEDARESAETARANAESARAQSEDGRQSAEAARTNSDNERAGAEALRAAAESERANAESGRVSAEQGRVAAESERVAAETERAETFAGYEARIDAVTPDDSAVDGKPWTSEKIVEALCPPFETTGSIVQCHPVEHYPLGVVSRIDATQSGTGDASPDNIRPIVGWDSVSMTRCGKNISKSNAFGGVAWAYTDANTTKLINSLPAGTYQISFTITLNKFSDRFTSETIPADGLCALYRLNEGTPLMSMKYLGTVKKIYRTDSLPKSVNISETIVINEEDVGCKKQIYFYGCGRNSYAEGAPNGPLGTASVSNLQIELGSTATPYESYTGDTYTAELPEKIYGGELDWITGVFTVTHGQIASYAGETLPGEWISDRDVYAPDATPTTGAQVAYKLAEPYTIQLTPQQITALSGVNTLYTDSGDTAFSGRADPIWLIQSLMDRIAALESAATNI